MGNNGYKGNYYLIDIAVKVAYSSSSFSVQVSIAYV
ncbi:hypothetical protein GKR41_00025 [Candidatus Vallotia lariciata]|nr:hypothetical protein GKR41_00025 [Candidatus Vallotia lariciata]